MRAKGSVYVMCLKPKAHPGLSISRGSGPLYRSVLKETPESGQATAWFRNHRSQKEEAIGSRGGQCTVPASVTLLP